MKLIPTRPSINKSHSYVSSTPRSYRTVNNNKSHEYRNFVAASCSHKSRRKCRIAGMHTVNSHLQLVTERSLFFLLTMRPMSFEGSISFNRRSYNDVMTKKKGRSFLGKVAEIEIGLRVG
ncbi:hypothetical protein CEXT_774261 [Caerostris extrusa]|uniref:Uncharacterized protein n=1 Tax=Caerostris extrusa TaxID=172846 RepID=A0AAV4V554_CAEEX|nr:hypothetical protein CEXT_774261 [Caerostris extrusa]